MLKQFHRIKKAKRNRPLEDNTSTGTSIFAGLRGSGPLTLGRKPLATTSPNESAPVVKINPLGATPPLDKTSPYLVQLKALNESVSEWIRKHVSTYPYVDLTPIFKDYQSHLTTIEAKVGEDLEMHFYIVLHVIVSGSIVLV